MNLFRSVFTISFFISISRIMGFIRDILIAKFLGVSVLSDVFFAAFRLPNFFRRIFAEGAFNSAFVPIFVSKMDGDKKTGPGENAIEFCRNVFSMLVYVLLILVILMEIFMPFVVMAMFPGFKYGSEKFLLLVDLSRITIIYLIFISAASLFTGVLNSINKFAVGAASSIILNLTLILSLYLLADVTPNLAYALSFGVMIGGILQFSWMMFFLVKEKIFIYPKFPKITADTKKFFKKLIPGVIGANVMQINLLVDTIIASLITGAISYIYYADRINQLPLSMIGIAIGIALLPNLSSKIKNKDYKNAIKLQNIALEIGLMLVIPAMLALSCLSYQIITVLFERGSFDTDATTMVSRALCLYSIGLPAYVLVKIFEPSFFARGNTKTPMKIAIMCLIANVAFNIIFFKPFGYMGIILSSVLSSYLNISLVVTRLMKNDYFYFEKDFLNRFIRTLIPSVAMFIWLTLLKKYFENHDFISQSLELVALISSGLFAYFIISYFAGNIDFLIKNFTKPKNLKNVPEL